MKNLRQRAGLLATAFLIFSSMIIVTSCKKDKKDPDPEPTPAPAPVPETNTQKLTGKNFKLTALTVNPAFFGITDIYAQMSDCDKDDIYRFEVGGVYKEDEGGTKCNSNDPQTVTGTWTWNTNETVLTTITGTDNIANTIVINDGTTLKTTVTENDGTTNYVFTSTYVKQ